MCLQLPLRQKLLRSLVPRLRRQVSDCKNPCDRQRFSRYSSVDDDPPNYADRWRMLFFAGLAAVGLLHLIVYTTVKHEERPEFVAYPHLRLRKTPFPWGDGNHSLFHNCEKNALPDGYEDCECSTKH